MKNKTNPGWLLLALCTFGLAAVFGATGCQMSIGGQTLPSSHYLEDDVQYYAPSTEFKLSREASAMKAYKADQELQRTRQSQ